MKINFLKYTFFIAIISVIVSCMITSHSDNYQTILNSNLDNEELGKAKFLYGDMGGIYPHTLKSNAFSYKIAMLGLAQFDTTEKEFNEQKLLKKYGFIFPKKISNYENSNLLNTTKPLGLVYGKLSGTLPTKGKYFIETADFGCATCHGGVLYNESGNPTDEFVLGIPNTSINLEAFASNLFEGYKIIIKWNEREFSRKILEKYPTLSSHELNGLKLIFGILKKEVKKIVATRKKVSPYVIGAPGLTNGLGALKRGLGLLNAKVYNEKETSLISIPALADRSFRSSLLVSGNYAPKGGNFFYNITDRDTNKNNDLKIAKAISVFTIATMGFSDKMAAKTIDDLDDVMKFISKLKTPNFPAKILSTKAEEGRVIFENNCQTCHGIYKGTSTKNSLVSFPNLLIPLSYIQTDTLRAVSIKNDELNALQKLKVYNFLDAKLNEGYVAPILTGIWTTAPYLHNGSVPTLWHLMHPETRPSKFYIGGHQLDFEKMGIKGKLDNAIYKYSDNYLPWSNYEIYDTNKLGLSNKGHNEPFNRMTENEKDCVLEFLKTL